MNDRLSGHALLRRWAAFTQKVARATSPSQLLDSVLASVPTLLDADVAAILLVRPSTDTPPLLHIRAVRHLERGVLLAIRDRLLEEGQRDFAVALDPSGVLVHVDVPHEGAAIELTSTEFVPIPAAGTSSVDAPLGLLLVASEQALAPDTRERLALVAEHFSALYAHVTSRIVDERRRLARLVESIPDGLVMSDPSGRLLLVNPAARRLLRLGTTPLGEVARLIADRLGFDPFIPEAFGGSVPHTRRLIVGETALEVIITAAVEQDGARLGNVLVAHDVTLQRQLDARKDEFVSLVSHELRTPLQSLSGALELLLRQFAGELNAKQHRYVEVAYDSSRRLERIVDDLLAVARAAEGNLRLHPSDQDLAALVQTLVDPIRPVLESRGIELRLRTWIRARALVDTDRLSQVISNLLSNALKFTPPKGRIDVEVWSSTGLPGWVLCSVYNTGAPIPAEFHERIFEKFEQVERSATRSTEGAGLGLAICQNIVGAHGGRIWVEPELDGARFVFSLPTNEQSREETAVRGRFVGAHRLVVVASASRGPGLLVRHMLERAGYRVRTALGPDRAPTVSEHAADVIVVWLDERHPTSPLAPKLDARDMLAPGPTLAIGKLNDPDGFVALQLPTEMATIVAAIDQRIAESTLHDSAVRSSM